MKENMVFNPNLVVIVVENGFVTKVYNGDAETEHLVIYKDMDNAASNFKWPEIQFDDDAVEELLGDRAEDYMVSEDEL